jgi:hypothetical protein
MICRLHLLLPWQVNSEQEAEQLWRSYFVVTFVRTSYRAGIGAVCPSSCSVPHYLGYRCCSMRPARFSLTIPPVSFIQVRNPYLRSVSSYKMMARQLSRARAGNSSYGWDEFCRQASCWLWQLATISSECLPGLALMNAVAVSQLQGPRKLHGGM